MSKPNILLAAVLTIVFGALENINSRIIVDTRDASWIITSVAAACVYAFLATKYHEPFLLSLGKLELIVFVCQLLGFGIYALKSNAWEHRDIAAWFYFYPYLFLAAAVVFAAYSFCFWLLRFKK